MELMDCAGRDRPKPPLFVDNINSTEFTDRVCQELGVDVCRTSLVDVQTLKIGSISLEQYNHEIQELSSLGFMQTRRISANPIRDAFRMAVDCLLPTAHNIEFIREISTSGTVIDPITFEPKASLFVRYKPIRNG